MSTVGDYTVKLWDLGAPESPCTVLSSHGDTIQCIAFNPTGQLLVTTCRDRKIRLFDPCAGGDAVRVGEGHGGIKGARVVWMGNRDRIATTGFSKMSDRQICLWEAGSLRNLSRRPRWTSLRASRTAHPRPRTPFRSPASLTPTLPAATSATTTATATPVTLCHGMQRRAREYRYSTRISRC